jgi:hypothetical protein
MTERVCLCGLRLNRTDRILYYVDDMICCNLHCLNEAINGATPLDRDGYMRGDPQISEE